MKLNRKGYLTVEIILASAVAFAIAFFLMEITVKLVSRTDDVYHDTIITYDTAIMINNIKDKIEEDIVSQDGLYSISCNNNECQIVYGRGNNSYSRILYYDTNSKEIKYANAEKIDLYSKKVDDSIGEVIISSNIDGTIGDSDNMVLFKIKLKNIFTDNENEMVIPINIMSSDPISNIFVINLSMDGHRGKMNTTISFDKRNGEPDPIYLHDNYDQLFESSSSDTLMECYYDKEKKNKYDFVSLGTMRCQKYYWEITTDIPNVLYCDFSEKY